VTHIKQQKYFFNHLKGRGFNTEFLLHGPLGDENIFLLFYMCHFAMALTHCYKTTVFFTFIIAVFLLNLLYTYSFN